MNKFAQALLLALIFAAPVTAFTSEAQAGTIHTHSTKAAKAHHKHRTHLRHHSKNLAHKTHK